MPARAIEGSGSIEDRECVCGYVAFSEYARQTGMGRELLRNDIDIRFPTRLGPAITSMNA